MLVVQLKTIHLKIACAKLFNFSGYSALNTKNKFDTVTILKMAAIKRFDNSKTCNFFKKITIIIFYFNVIKFRI